MHVGKKKGKDGDTVFSMSDVEEVKALKPEDRESAGLLHCFRVSQPPMVAVLQCSCEDERQRWIQGINERMVHWKDKRVEEGCA